MSEYLLSCGDICKVKATGELVMRVVGLNHYTGSQDWQDHNYRFVSVMDNGKHEYDMWGHEVEFIFSGIHFIDKGTDKYDLAMKSDLKKKGQLSIFDLEEEEEEE